MAASPKNPPNKSSNTVKPVKAKSPSKSTRNIVRIHPIKGNLNQLAKLDWDAKTGGFVGSLITPEEAAAHLPPEHRPTVSPVFGDPTKKIRCDWDFTNNQQICEVIDATDPRATLP